MTQKRRSKGEGSIYYWKKKGLWVSKITLPDGTARVKYGKLQKDVREHHLKALNDQRYGMLPKNDTITFGEFISNYMENVAKHTLRAKTMEANLSLIRSHIVPTIGMIKLVHLRPDHLQTLYSKKLESGLSKRTVQYVHSIIHKILHQALLWGLVVRNVADLVKAPPSVSIIVRQLPPII